MARSDDQQEQANPPSPRAGKAASTLGRRAVIVASALGAISLGIMATGAEPTNVKVWEPEGELKVHPKFLYRYYIALLDGQRCALFGSEHEREPGSLTQIQLPARVHVRGVLGAAQHVGGSEGAPSTFPAGWIVYMDVSEVELLVEEP